MILTVQIIGVLAVAFLFYFAYRLFEKDHVGKSSTFALIGVVILFCSFPWFQGFVKSWISARMDARLAALGQQVNDVQSTTTAMQRELSEHQVRIDEHQKQLDEAQGKFLKNQDEFSKQQSDLKNQFQQMINLQTNLNVAQSNILNQEEQIQDVQYLVNNLFSKTVVENLSGSDTNNVLVINRTNGLPMVFFRLKHVPIVSSVHCVVSGSGQQFPLKPFRGTTQNLLGTFWEGSDPRVNNFTFEYVGNSRETNLMGNTEVERLMNGLQSMMK